METLVARVVEGVDIFSAENAIGRTGLFPIERDVLEAIVRSARGEESSSFRQIGALNVSGREFTGVGFFANFVPMASEPGAEALDEVISAEVTLRAPGLRYDAGFLLFVEKGAPVMLEGFAHAGPWPAVIDRYELLPSPEPDGNR
ncbi:MAG: hypothetical protein AB7J30_14155 [Hyphomicrobium sp.]|uniref:hypothetical protein n=1 Tax=Hyphomicrobium sp. TaxID=82 RepID=UPI003D0C5C28